MEQSNWTRINLECCGVNVGFADETLLPTVQRDIKQLLYIVCCYEGNVMKVKKTPKAIL